ncbi:Uncharacterised protein [Pseudomonas aeruginosa]|nr:Uncharacterised protein [Pseudomonas aeruginosa]
MESETDHRRCAPGPAALLAERPGEAATPGTARAPDQAGGLDRLQVGKQIQVGRVAGVAQPALAERLAGAGAHQPGRRDETVQRPSAAAEQLDAGGQAGLGLGVVEGIELSLPGVDATHEVLPWSTRWWGVIVVIEAVESQFVTPGYPPREQFAELFVGFQRVAMVEVGHYQPGHGDLTERVHGLDEGPVVRPGFRGHVVQHQQQAAFSHSAGTSPRCRRVPRGSAGADRRPPRPRHAGARRDGGRAGRAARRRG